MIYKIQLASNFQTIEFEMSGEFDENSPEIQKAVKLVNYLGGAVVNNAKGSNKPKEEMATIKQIELLNKFKIDATGLTKKQASAKIRELTDA